MHRRRKKSAIGLIFCLKELSAASGNQRNFAQTLPAAYRETYIARMSSSACNFEIIVTGDGSPSLQTQGQSWSEKMHHSGGALSETIFLYGRAMEVVLSQRIPPRFLVVGLGLGYIELVASALFLARAQARDQSLQLLSFESSPVLVENLLAWLRGEPTLHPSWRAVYDQILQGVANHYAVRPAAITEHLMELLRGQSWKIEGALGVTDSAELATTQSPGAGDEKFTAILFDAFSKSATPELWTPEFLNSFLLRYAAPQCLFATYASFGVLKRQLRESGFLVPKVPGFSGRRECTLATRALPETP